MPLTLLFGSFFSVQSFAHLDGLDIFRVQQILNRYILLLLCCLAGVFAVHAQPPVLDLNGLNEAVPVAAPVNPDAKQDAPQANPMAGKPIKRSVSFWTLLQSGGIIGYVIILLSLVAVALIIEYSLSIRRMVLVPTGFADEILKMLAQGQAGLALQKCQNDPSVLGQILFAGMNQYEFGWDAVEKSAEEAAAEQASRLYRRVEYLNVIANLAPMLGLLGTVVGMVLAFQQIADSAGYGRAADFAEGISLALITTVEGLVVAIPCLAAHSFFGNRIATLISETTYIAEQVLQPIKRNLLRSKKQS